MFFSSLEDKDIKMNKLIISCVLCSSMIYANAWFARTNPKPQEVKEITKKSKTGFMLGIENGYNLYQVDNQTTFAINIGVNAGYNVYFNKTFGLRIFGNYSYFVSNLSGTSNLANQAINTPLVNYSDTQRFGFGLDFLYDFFNDNDLGLSLGIFGGVFGGYDITPLYASNGSNIYRNGFFTTINLGFDIIFNSHNRIDLSYRYSVLNAPFILNGDSETSSNVSSPFAFVIGYSYIF